MSIRNDRHRAARPAVGMLAAWLVAGALLSSQPLPDYKP